MAECIILVRNPRGGLLIISDDNEADDPAVFATNQDAQKWADQSNLCQAWAYQIVEVDI